MSRSILAVNPRTVQAHEIHRGVGVYARSHPTNAIDTSPLRSHSSRIEGEVYLRWRLPSTPSGCRSIEYGISLRTVGKVCDEVASVSYTGACETVEEPS
jgi:hypothetical protein